MSAHDLELDPYEQWLLEMVVTLRYPVGLLASPELALHLNRPGHGLSSAEIAPRVHHLERRGLITIFELHDQHGCDDDKDIGPQLSLAALTTHLARGHRAVPRAPNAMYFGLTRAGGAAWEGLALPAWDRYVEDDADARELVVTSPTRERVEAVVRCFFGDDPGVRAEATWETVAPWKATYWKVLPSAIRCHIPGGYDREGHLDPPNWDPDLRRWFRPVALPT